ncbi:restriction endonuclease subunit S [Niabella insulamsoli]|uniref:restriction endonuclease subunit S n=1 Tax=Niabella insulamsoli TaxID=3144874 RepID=UPI0031FBA5BF
MEKVFLKTITKQIRGVSYKPEDISKENADGFIPLLRAGNIGTSNISNLDDLVYVSEKNVSNQQYLQSGDILIAASSGSIDIVGKSVYIEKNQGYTFGAFCKVIRPNSELVNPKYVSFYFKTDYYRKTISNLAQGANINNLKNEHIDNLEIPLPDLETQNKIVAILDKAKAILDKREETIKKYDELLRATFLEMFGDPVKNEKGWEKGIIRNVVDEVKYGTSKPAEENGNFPYLRMNNITYEGYMDYSNLKYINIEEKEREKYIVQKDDLLFNRTNSKELVGKTGIFDSENEMVIAGYLIRVRSNKLANTHYLWGYLNSKHGKQTLFSMCKNIVGMANINAQEFQNIEILKPPIELQNRFKSIYLKIAQTLTTLRKSKEHIESLAGGLSQQAFKGELDFNTAVDLEVLLENDFQFFQENSNSGSIRLFLERLNTDELNENRFYEQQTYDKAKSFVFELIKEGKVKQVFDEKTKKVTLTV